MSIKLGKSLIYSVPFILMLHTIVYLSVNFDKSKVQLDKLVNNFANSELNKLQKRRQRWQKAEKCLMALRSVNGKVDELCNYNQDIYILAKNAGFIHATPIVESHIKAINYYEKQLKDGIIDKLPNDEPMTLKSNLELINTTFDSIRSLRDENTEYIKICIYKAGVGEVNYEECVQLANERYQTARTRIETEQIEAGNYLKDFEKNYKQDE